LLSNAAKSHDIDPALVFAIARRESSFMHDAYSTAGAAGLMQLKPSTASYVAKSKVNKGQLFVPERNALLGSDYLSYLLDETRGNLILTTAAYNAGIGRVKRWLPESQMPADAWIETIPYKETRNYVKAVVAYSKVYQQRLSSSKDVFGDVTGQQIAPSL
jgi:soluble lytic murein transglycosylase